MNYVLTVLGEKSKAITRSRITLNGKAYKSDDKGNVHISFPPRTRRRLRSSWRTWRAARIR